MSRQKEEILCEFVRPKLTGKAAEEYKRVRWKTLIWPLLRISIIGSIGWVLAIFLLYYYLPELFDSESKWLKIALMGPGVIVLLYLMCLLQVWLGSLGESKYVITDKVIKYESSGAIKSIKWKDIHGYRIEQKEGSNDDALTVLLYRKNKRVRPFVIVVPQAYADKVTGLIEQRVEPLGEEPPDLRSEAVQKGNDLKSMLSFSLVMGVLAGVLLQIENLRFLSRAGLLGGLLIFVLGPGTLWVLVRRPSKIFDGFYVSSAVFSNLIGNLIMLFILIIKHLRDIFDKT
ncbi:MAG: hypothetical protein ACYTEX_09640 [Planctomycetota bacterium]